MISFESLKVNVSINSLKIARTSGFVDNHWESLPWGVRHFFFSYCNIWHFDWIHYEAVAFTSLDKSSFWILSKSQWINVIIPQIEFKMRNRFGQQKQNTSIDQFLIHVVMSAFFFVLIQQERMDVELLNIFFTL